MKQARANAVLKTPNDANKTAQPAMKACGTDVGTLLEVIRVEMVIERMEMGTKVALMRLKRS